MEIKAPTFNLSSMPYRNWDVVPAKSAPYNAPESPLTSMFSSLRSLGLQLAVAAYTLTPVSALAFGGPIPPLPGTPTGVDVRATVTQLMLWVLDFLALVAVVVIVIAGIRLIVSQGNEDQKETAKKTIFYAIAGLLVILFARVIVGLVTQELPRFVSGT